MWDGLLMLLFLSIIMGAASFLAGSLPLSFSLSSRQLRLVTALGTGVLVGTSLIVIIPEGVETLYSSGIESHSVIEPVLPLQAREAIPHIAHALLFEPSAYARDTASPLAGLRRDESVAFEDVVDGSDSAGYSDLDDDEPAGDDEQYVTTPAAEEDFEPHAWIGVSLILGFILMYLIDTLPQAAASHSKPQRLHVNLGQFSFNRFSSGGSEEALSNDAFPVGSSLDPPPKLVTRPSSTTVGLVIHAAADGIALGASSTSSSSRLSFIIFIALMIHKAPAAFGLTSVLLKQGLTKRTARTHLIVFSLAAPVGALLTWSAVHLLGFSSNTLGGSASTEFGTGVLLLFSGGTFLYVAMHTMQETGGVEHDDSRTNGHAGIPMGDPYAAHLPPPPSTGGPSLTDSMVTVAGMLLPLLTQIGHAH